MEFLFPITFYINQNNLNLYHFTALFIYFIFGIFLFHVFSFFLVYFSFVCWFLSLYSYVKKKLCDVVKFYILIILYYINYYSCTKFHLWAGMCLFNSL